MRGGTEDVYTRKCCILSNNNAYTHRIPIWRRRTIILFHDFLVPTVVCIFIFINLGFSLNNTRKLHSTQLCMWFYSSYRESVKYLATRDAINWEARQNLVPVGLCKAVKERNRWYICPFYCTACSEMLRLGAIIY